MKPAACERGVGRLLVTQVSLHADVAAQHDFTDGLAVARHRLHGGRIDHVGIGLKVVTHALARKVDRTLVCRQIFPSGLGRANRARPINLGQPVDMRQRDAERFHGLNQRCRWCRSRDHAPHAAPGRLGHRLRLELIRRVDQHAVYDRRAAIMRDPMVGNRVEDSIRADPAQTDVDAGARRDRPGKAPPVAMEHRECPEVDRMRWQIPLEDIAHGVHVGAAVMVNDTLGLARRA